MNYRVLWAHISSLFKHMSQTVIKFGGYAGLQSGDFAKVIKDRLAQVQMARSTLSIIPLDKDDDLAEQTLHGLSGALEILKYAQEELAQAARMPLTKLFGHMPQGFSKDDDAGRDNWHAHVHGAQEDYLLEPLTDLIEMIASAYKIQEPEEWSVLFMPIDVPDGLTAADIDLKEAQADDLRIQNHTIAPVEARNALRSDARCRYPLADGPAEVDEIVHPPSPTPEQQLAMKQKAAKPAGGAA
jgi:phage-related protein (TIGR01555 family)